MVDPFEKNYPCLCTLKVNIWQRQITHIHLWILFIIQHTFLRSYLIQIDRYEITWCTLIQRSSRTCGRLTYKNNNFTSINLEYNVHMGFRIICSIVKILKRQTVTAPVVFTFNSVEESVSYNIRNSSRHFGPPVIIVISQSALKQLVELSIRLRSAKCLRADWSVTIIPWGPQWCLLFLKYNHT